MSVVAGIAWWALTLAIGVALIAVGTRLMSRYRPPRLILAAADRLGFHYVAVGFVECVLGVLSLLIDPTPWWLRWPLVIVALTSMWPLLYQPARGYVQHTDAATTQMTRVIAETLDTEWEDILALHNRMAVVLAQHSTVAERVALGIPPDKAGSMAYLRRYADMMTRRAVGVGRHQGFIESRTRHAPVRLLPTMVREFGLLVGAGAVIFGRTQVRAAPQKMSGRQLRLTGEEE